MGPVTHPSPVIGERGSFRMIPVTLRGVKMRVDVSWRQGVEAAPMPYVVSSIQDVGRRAHRAYANIPFQVRIHSWVQDMRAVEKARNRLMTNTKPVIGILEMPPKASYVVPSTIHAMLRKREIRGYKK